MKIQPLPTPYGGFVFRSRTEARWAVFLDELGVKWDYEREAYDCSGQNYLPDFWLPHLSAWLEIKGVEPTFDECEKARRLAAGTSGRVYIAVGEPRPPVSPNGEWDESMWLIDDAGTDYSHWWTQCPRCHEFGIEFSGRAERLACRCLAVYGSERCYCHDSPQLLLAYEKARRAFTGPEWGRPRWR